MEIKKNKKKERQERKDGRNERKKGRKEGRNEIKNERKEGNTNDPGDSVCSRCKVRHTKVQSQSEAHQEDQTTGAPTRLNHRQLTA